MTNDNYNRERLSEFSAGREKDVFRNSVGARLTLLLGIEDGPQRIATETERAEAAPQLPTDLGLEDSEQRQAA